MKRLAGALLLTVFLAALPLWSQIRLPASMRLAGPVNDNVSSLADAISHYPFGNGFGGGAIHGWLAIDFSPPNGRTAKFRITWQTVGDEPVITFESGHFIKARAVGCLPSGVQASTGKLNLDNGTVSDLDVHAVFQNLLIDRTSRNNRFPLDSRARKFTVLFGDYPPIDFPFPLEISDPPKTYNEAKFTTDGSGNITGFEFRGATFLPLAAVPKVALMPTYSFAAAGDTFVPGADGCLPNTTPVDQCLTYEKYPDGLVLAPNAHLSPELVLSTQELRDPGAPRPNPAARATGAVVGAAAAGVGTQLWTAGGLDASGDPSAAVSMFDPARNQWTAGRDLPSAVWQACGVSVGNLFYVIGGRGSANGPPVNTVNVLETSSNAWSSSPALPMPLADAACAAVNGRIYVMGGWGNAGNGAGMPSSQAWLYVPGALAWAPLPDMPAPLAGAAVAVNGSDIYVVNGSQDGSSATNRVHILSTATGTWREAPPTNRAVYEASAAFLSGRLFLAGGRTAPGAGPDAGNVHYLTQPMQVLVGNTWFAGLEPPLTAAGMGSALVGQTWFLAGGDTSLTPGARTPTDAVQAYTVVDGWLVSDTHPIFISEGVRNAASLGVGPAALAPGALASILGYHLANVTRAAPPIHLADGFYTTDLPEKLGGVQVTVDDQPAGLTAVAPDRVDFQVPFGISAGPVPRRVKVQLLRNGVAAPPVAVPLVDSAPGLFIYSHGETRELGHLDGSGAVAFNQNGGLNYGGRPAQRGTTITLRATGLGDVNPRPAPLQRAPRDVATTPVNAPQVLIDGRAAEVDSVRLVPGEAGVYEVRAAVPLDARTGRRVNVQLRSGDVLSNTAVLVIQ